jgi:site-specific DNA recombinase
MIAKPVRYFLYARKSSENEDKQVASVPSQIEELKKLAQEMSLNIIEIFTEEKSAKAPGRPVFSQMIADIHKGGAEGILCWKLDRLARNPIDGGTISWMLQQSVIRHIQTFQRGYHPTDNVLMMNLEFGMANQFVIDLSANTKRGQRSKIQDGWLPHKPPIGYVNNYYNQPDKPPIYPEPYSFPFMKKLWGILLEKRCTLDKLFDIAQNLGFKEDRGH